MLMFNHPALWLSFPVAGPFYTGADELPLCWGFGAGIPIVLEALIGDQDSNLRSLSMVIGFIRNPVKPNCSQVPCASASAVTA